MPSDRRSPFFRSYENAAEIVSGISRDQLGAPTPCSDYDVAALIDHIVGAAHRAVSVGRGEALTGDEFPHVDLSDAPDQLLEAEKEARAAWADDSTLVTTTTMPWGEAYTGAVLVDMYLAELAAHAWDLAAATGQVGRLDADLAGPALQGAQSMLKPEYRNLMEPGSPFGSEVEPPPDATDWERMAAFMGRNPRPVFS